MPLYLGMPKIPFKSFKCACANEPVRHTHLEKRLLLSVVGTKEKFVFDPHSQPTPTSQKVRLKFHVFFNVTQKVFLSEAHPRQQDTKTLEVFLNRSN